MSTATEQELVHEIQQLNAYAQLELVNDESSLNALQKAIAERIALLASGPMERLLQLLYRVDVKEALAREAFAKHTDTAQLADALATLVLQRMLQKAETRIQYRNGTL